MRAARTGRTHGCNPTTQHHFPLAPQGPSTHESSIRPTRWFTRPRQRGGAVVVREMIYGHRPAVWISDRYTAQQGHAAAHQTCLAHLARDVAYAVETSDDPVPWRLQLWLRSVFALAERVTDFAPSTLAAKRRTLDRRPRAILATSSGCDLTRDLQAKIGRARSTPGLPRPSRRGRAHQ